MSQVTRLKVGVRFTLGDAMHSGECGKNIGVMKKGIMKWLLVCLVLGVLPFLIPLGTQSSEQENRNQKIDILWSEFKDKFPDVPFVTISNVQDFLLKNEKIVLIDVRSASEQKISRIRGALSQTEFLSQEKSQYKNQKVIVYCTIGYRSAEAVRELKKAGYHALNLKGGILSWAWGLDAKKELPPIIDSQGKLTKKIHVYGKKWNILPKDFQSVW